MKYVSKNRLAAKTSAVSKGLLAACLFASPLMLQAQGGFIDGNEKRYGDVPLVSIFEDCDYRGERRDITVGEYNAMSRAGFPNDKLSSIRVPRDLEVVIFRDNDFKGDYARVNKNVRCFDDYWNDEVSSLKVEYVDGREPAIRNPETRKPYPRSSDPRAYDRRDGVTGKNVSQVVFKGRVLRQVNKRQWELQDFRNGVDQYTEVQRDKNAVYLENEYSNAKLRIDLFANDVTMISPRGKVQRFGITSRDARLAATPRQPKRPDFKPREPNRRIKGDCFYYNAYTAGGQGGVRFHGKEGFYRFGKKSHTGRVCHNGTLTMEINKTNPDTKVVVEIQGKKFVFARGEKEDAYKNTWYRKLVKLKVQ